MTGGGGGGAEGFGNSSHVFHGEIFETGCARDFGAGRGAVPRDSRAGGPSQVLLVQKAGFLGLLKRQPELALRMLGAMSLHLRVLVGQLEDLTLKDVETRLANWLVKRCPDPAAEPPVNIQLNTTKRVLAAELRTISETFSRTLAKFRAQNLIRVKGTTITVLSPARLAAQLRRYLGE